MILRRTLWTLWALVPIAVLAFHLGPGREAAGRAAIVGLQAEAIEAEKQAIIAQRQAHAAHLVAIDARRRAMLTSGEAAADGDAATAAAAAELTAALAREEAAYAAAAERWELAADRYETVLDAADALPEIDRRRIRLSRGRALVRSGDIWGGAGELQALLEEVEPRGEPTGPDTADLARSTREELAAAHYFAARLLRLAGEPVEDWQAEAAAARGHYRHLARTAEADGDANGVRGFQDNVERVLDLEQQEQAELVGMPLPGESPRMSRGSRPGRGNEAGRSRRPPRDGEDARGASGVEAIGRGW